MSFTVFLGNLPIWVTADDIRGWLSAENLVADAIKVIRNPETQESKGFAFIDAPNTEEMNAIIRRFDRAPLEDRLLRANPAQPPRPKSQGQGPPGRSKGPGSWRLWRTRRSAGLGSVLSRVPFPTRSVRGKAPESDKRPAAGRLAGTSSRVRTGIADGTWSGVGNASGQLRPRFLPRLAKLGRRGAEKGSAKRRQRRRSPDRLRRRVSESPVDRGALQKSAGRRQILVSHLRVSEKLIYSVAAAFFVNWGLDS